MLAALTRDTFSPCVDDEFSVRSEPDLSVTLRLREVRELPGSAVPGGREPFALLFVGPREPILPQRIYPFQHPRLGTFEIFIVPIGVDSDGARYEAIFT